MHQIKTIHREIALQTSCRIYSNKLVFSVHVLYLWRYPPAYSVSVCFAEMSYGTPLQLSRSSPGQTSQSSSHPRWHFSSCIAARRNINRSIRNHQVGFMCVMNKKGKFTETIPTLGLEQLSQLTSEWSLQKLLLNFSSPKYASSWILLHSIVFSQKCTMLWRLLKCVALACLSPSRSTVRKGQ